MKPLKGFTLPTVIDPKVGLADRVEETFRGRGSVFQCLTLALLGWAGESGG